MTDVSVSPSAFDHETWAAALHAGEGQLYGGKPYGEAHLAKVEQVLLDFGYTSMTWRRAAWLHDVIEDCLKHLTPAERLEIVRERYGERVSELVWAVSGIGPNRKARNADIYAKIAADPEAAILKVADRIVNVEQTIADRSPHIGMYLKEAEEFEVKVARHAPAAMRTRLQAGLDRLYAIQCGEG